ncbi:hypothetical protein FIE12Z_6476 [Fusarium flagelliforme]|uniref:Uncharacterized protein n=1 Tax=Fusarium flagelliforme TaxID=2675880 RepID=A0A395MNY3_9HYPO|nr:hypothetical protein FIE12Z_6476 [Fusarium flagelliforme]
MAWILTLCGDSEAELQKCICTKRSDEVAAAISTDVKDRCGPSATEDIASASKVMRKYCHQDKHVAFSSPTANIVKAHITDLPELENLPPCAQKAVSHAVVEVGSERCPQALELNMPCICHKADVVQDFKSTLSREVKKSCSHSEDVTSAQNFYSQFCHMNRDKTSFASPKGPLGDMSYYITALPHFKSLDKCVQKGVSSAVMDQSSWLCGNGPQELASCVCIKSGMYKIISSSLVDKVNNYCDGTQTGNTKSAIDVFQYYCSAAKDLVVATVSLSTSQPHTTGTSSTQSSTAIPKVTGSAGASATATTNVNTAKESGSGDEDKKQEDSDTHIMPIVGGVAGAAILAALGVRFFLIIRRERRRKTRGERLSDGPPEYPGDTDNSNPFTGHSRFPITSELSPPASTKSKFNGGVDVMEHAFNHTPTARLQAHLAKMNHGRNSPMGPPPQYSWRPNAVSQRGTMESYEMRSNYSVSISGDSLVVTDPTTNPPLTSLTMGERTGSRIFW